MMTHPGGISVDQAYQGIYGTKTERVEYEENKRKRKCKRARKDMVQGTKGNQEKKAEEDKEEIQGGR